MGEGLNEGCTGQGKGWENKKREDIKQPSVCKQMLVSTESYV